MTEEGLGRTNNYHQKNNTQRNITMVMSLGHSDDPNIEEEDLDQSGVEGDESSEHDPAAEELVDEEFDSDIDDIEQAMEDVPDDSYGADEQSIDVRKAIEERLDDKRLKEDLDYLDLDLDEQQDL